MECKICGNSKNNTFYYPKEMMFGFRDVFKYILCSRCGCLQISEIPKNLDKYYPADYYSFNYENYYDDTPPLLSRLKRVRDGYELSGGSILGRFLSIFFPGMIFRVLANARLSKISKILDVGCGRGQLLNKLKALGYCNLSGIDPYINKDISYDGGLNILKKGIFNVDDNYDFIMFNHSFEHISNPLDTMRRAAGLLNKNGMCMIRTPTVSSYAWRYYGVDWVQLDAPRHFFLFSIEAMNILADRAGLKIVKVIYDSTEFQFWGSEQYKNGIPLISDKSYAVNPSLSIFSSGEIRKFRRKAILLNNKGCGDSVAVFLCKKSEFHDS